MSEDKQSVNNAARGLKSAEFWILNCLAVLAVVGAITNGFLQFSNYGLKDDIRRNRMVIEKSQKLSRINNQLIQALANISAKTGDESIRSLLFSQGISFTVNPSPLPSESDGKNASSSGAKN